MVTSHVFAALLHVQTELPFRLVSCGRRPFSEIPFVALPKLNHAHSRNLWIGFIPSIVHPFPNQEAMMQTGEKRIRVISVIVWHHILHDDYILMLHTHASQLDG